MTSSNSRAVSMRALNLLGFLYMGRSRSSNRTYKGVSQRAQRSRIHIPSATESVGLERLAQMLGLEELSNTLFREKVKRCTFWVV